MKVFTSITVIWVLLQTVNGEENTSLVYNETVHIFLLLVRDSALSRIHLLRQDDEDGGGGTSFAETGEYLGQIIQGVLGGDAVPIFAGSLKFVEEPTAQQNLGNFLGTIAPAVNVVLRDIFTRAQVAFGFATTPKPTTVSPQPILIEFETEDQLNSTLVNSNGTYIYEYDTNTTATTPIGQPKQQQMNQVVRSPAVPALAPAAPTTSWEYVLNRINGETTTVQPLPLIRRTPAPTVPLDEDDEEGDSRIA